MFLKVVMASLLLSDLVDMPLGQGAGKGVIGSAGWEHTCTERVLPEVIFEALGARQRANFAYSVERVAA